MAAIPNRTALAVVAGPEGIRDANRGRPPTCLGWRDDLNERHANAVRHLRRRRAPLGRPGQRRTGMAAAWTGTGKRLATNAPTRPVPAESMASLARHYAVDGSRTCARGRSGALAACADTNGGTEKGRGGLATGQAVIAKDTSRSSWPIS
jgi:hypothetical protein